MGKARSITIDTISFDKAGEARTFFSSMLQRYSPGDRVSDDDTAHLKALLRRHDEEADKIGVGVSHMTVGPAPDYFNQQCFWINRVDGSRIDFSYQHCLEKKPYD